MIDNQLSKVDILIQQNKFGEAEKILKGLLAEDARNIHFISLLAEVMLQQDRLEEARNLVDNAIGLSPDSPHLFYTKSRVAIQQDDYHEAKEAINQAIALDPYDADYYALLANINLAFKQYEEALSLANHALEIDAENLLGLNTRSTALLKLNKTEESFATIEGALREAPNNPYTHANYGWGLLEKGSHEKALEHFKEALQYNPNFEYAQAGMMEALKASNPIYRLFLKYSFWIGNLTSKYQWGVILSFYFAMKLLRSIAKANEAWQPYLIPLIIVLAFLGISTWIMDPISNLFLRLNRFGKFLLDQNEKRSSNFVAIGLAVSVIGLVLYLLLSDDKFLTIAGFGLAMMLPFSLMFSPSRYKHAFLVYAVIMAITGLAAISLTFSTGEIFNGVTTIFIFGFVAFQWIANYLLIKENNS